MTPSPPFRRGSASRRLARRLAAPIRGARAHTGPERSPSLDEIGLRTGTDKSSVEHDYLGVYDDAFGHLRDRAVQLLEIGVHQGASLRMWEEYFPRGTLYGVDINRAARKHATERATILIGDQSSQDFLDRLAKRLRPTIVIDDGSHVWSHQIATLRTLYPVLRPGGYFVVEDIHTSFGADYTPVYGRDSGQRAYEYVERLTRGLTAGPRADPPEDEFEAHFRRTVESVQFVKHSVIIKKRAFAQRKYRVRSVAEVAPTVHRREVGAYERVPAVLVGANGEVRSAFDALKASSPVTPDPAATAEIRGAMVLGSGLVVTQDGSILDETLNCVRNTARGSLMYQAVKDTVWVNEQPLDGATDVPALENGHHVLLKQTWDANYGHWMVDTLPKVGLLDGVADLSRCTFVLNRQGKPEMERVVTESLALFGISADQLLFLDRASYRFERLLVLGTLTRHPGSKSPLAVEILEQLGDGVPEKAGGSRLYVTRRGVGRRRLVNEDEVVDVVSGLGYDVVAPEELSVAEQVAAFRSANHVVGVQGAAMANLAFAPRGVSVLSLSTESMQHDYFYDLVCLKQGRYQGLQGVATQRPATIASDFTIDVEKLAECLAWLHSEHS